jgi:hypothetical protein
MDDGDFSDWELPPWDEADSPSEPPPPLCPGLEERVLDRQLDSPPCGHQ